MVNLNLDKNLENMKKVTFFRKLYDLFIKREQKSITKSIILPQSFVSFNVGYVSKDFKKDTTIAKLEEGGIKLVDYTEKNYIIIVVLEANLQQWSEGIGFTSN